MAIDNFSPEIWAARLLANLHKRLVFAALANRDYEGEIQTAGDTVRINAIGPVTITNYVKNQDHASPETLDDAQTALQITESKMFNFQIDDVDKAQANVNVMDGAMRESGYALADVADQFVAGKFLDAALANLIGTTAAPKTDLGTAGKAYQYLVQLGAKLSEQNVPTEGRFAVIPPWFHSQLLLDPNFMSFGTEKNLDVLQNGKVGRAAGFDLYESNNVPNTAGTLYRIIAGSRMAITYADQIRKVEAYRPERRFADAMKGLHLYGAKVIRPVALAVLTANPPA
jgi:N4-gp56 family major capsid protein